MTRNALLDQAVKIALEVKKHLVDNELLDISQVSARPTNHTLHVLSKPSCRACKGASFLSCAGCGFLNNWVA